MFPVPEDWQSYLKVIQEELYDCAGSVFSEKLPAHTFHITLHDLSSGENQRLVADNLEHHKAEILPLMKSIVQKDKPIYLRFVGVVSMVSSSIVVLFEPASEADHIQIQKLYMQIDELAPISYPLTLHCTLAYYKPGEYSPETWNALMWKTKDLNGLLSKRNVEMKLDCDALQYQQFSSMKDYRRL